MKYAMERSGTTSINSTHTQRTIESLLAKDKTQRMNKARTLQHCDLKLNKLRGCELQNNHMLYSRLETHGN